MNPIATEQKADPLTRYDARWVLLFVATAVINLGSAALIPRFATDGFSWPVFLACAVPILWAVFLFSSYRSFLERVITWAALVGAVYWALPALAMLGVTARW